MNESTGTVPTPPPLPSAARPPLRRSRTDRVLGGVAGGLARWLAIDPVIIRVVLVVLALFGGSGLLLYIVGWLFIPDEDQPKSEAEKLLDKTREPNSTGRTILIVIGVVVGIIVLGGIVGSVPWGGALGGGGWLLLLGAGGLVLWLVNRPPSGTATWIAPSAPYAPAAGTPPAPAADSVVPSFDTAEGAVAPFATDMAATTPGTVAYDSTGYAYGGYGGYPGYVAPVPAPAPPPAPRPRSYLGLAALSLSILTMGVLGALALSGTADIPAVVILAAGLGVLGLGLLVGSFAGRARWLIALALPLLLVTAVVAFFPANMHVGGGIGERTWTPKTPAAAAANHRLGLGSARLDLSDLVLPTGTSIDYPVRASVGFGELLVTVPEGMRVNVIATVQNGEIGIEGLPRRSGQDLRVTAELPGAVSDTSPTVDLIVDATIGTVEVSRA